MTPVVLASSRGPVAFQVGEDDAAPVPSAAGGLATALQGVRLGAEGVWVCAARTAGDLAVARAAAGRPVVVAVRGAQQRVRFVELDPQDARLTGTVAANPWLWFVQHGLWGLADHPSFGPAETAAFAAYGRVDERFADAVVAELDRVGPEAVVMLQDYHLYLVAPSVRRRRPEAFLHHFVHIPWPTPDTWSALPAGLGRRLLRGLLANDVVAFHTREWATRFVETCVRSLGAAVDAEVGGVRHEGRRTAVRVHPLSPTPEVLREIARDDETRRRRRALLADRPERLVVRVERADPTKNLVRGFEAVALLLERHPEHLGRVVVLALVQPTREDVPVYREHAREVVVAAARVNDRFGRPGWQPVVLREGDGREGALAALQEYDVLLVNAVRDGMNLVAKEGVLLNERDGVLVLSTEAGAHHELCESALGVHPLDLLEQAEALHRALSMPRAERRARLERGRAALAGRSAQQWLTDQLTEAAELRPRTVSLGAGRRSSR